MVHTLIGRDPDHIRNLAAKAGPTCAAPSAWSCARSRRRCRPGLDPSTLPPRDLDFIINRSFGRLYEESGLFGTVDNAGGQPRRLAKRGVDELACLVDFGPPCDEVLASLPYLNEVRSAFATAGL